jgi:CheY-like chemotaxis protein
MKQYKIVVVENDEDEQMFMREAFQSNEGFNLQTMAWNGDTLMEWLRDHPDDLPDLILSDLNMPGMNGYDIIKAISNNPKYKHIPVVITSTSSTKSMIEKCLGMGAAEYMVKPDVFIEYTPFVGQLYQLVANKKLAH